MTDNRKLYELIENHRDIIDASERILERQFDDKNIHNYDKDNVVKDLDLENIQLHRYQLAAIRWMKIRYDHNLSCIIADEMGEDEMDIGYWY